MPYRLNDNQMHELIAQPETGPGYQYVTATMSDYSVLKGVVLNGEIFIPDNKIEKIIGPQHLTYAAVLNESERPGYIRSIKVLSKDSIELGENKRFSKSAKAPALGSPILYTQKDQVYKRFSAYRNDRRIRADGSVLPGTYATTEVDAKNVKTGAEATLRYALPTDDPAVYVFTILPPEKVPMRMGVVEPANGKPGGGVEVLFDEGCPAGSAKRIDTIPAI